MNNEALGTREAWIEWVENFLGCLYIAMEAKDRLIVEDERRYYRRVVELREWALRLREKEGRP